MVPLYDPVASSHDPHCSTSNSANKLVNGDIVDWSLFLTYTCLKRVTLSFVLRRRLVQHLFVVDKRLFSLCYYVPSTLSQYLPFI